MFHDAKFTAASGKVTAAFNIEKVITDANAKTSTVGNTVHW
jgi:hypothetical protein